MIALIAGHKTSEVRMARDLLARLGIERIETVGHGAAAIRALRNAVPDLLVVDWEIPGDGADAIVAAARGRDKAPRILVTMSAPTSASVEAVKALQIDAVVAAPFSPRSFLDRVPRFERV